MSNNINSDKKNEPLFNEVVTPLILKGVESFRNKVNSSLAHLNSPKKLNSLNDYIELLNPKIDAFINKMQEKNSLQFIEGKIYFNINQEKKLLTHKTDYYFRDKNGKWILSTEKATYPLSAFNSIERLTKDLENISEPLIVDPPSKNKDSTSDSPFN